MNLKRNKGFTIVELVVVMAIIAILVLIAVPQYTRYIQMANDTKYMSEGSEIYTAIIESMEELVVKGENPYDIDKIIPIVNENMGNVTATRSSRSGSSTGRTIKITKGTDESLDVGNQETWGLVIDKDTQTITHNNKVDADHEYVFVNGVYEENYVPPTDGGGGTDTDTDTDTDTEGGDGEPDIGSDDPTLDQQATIISQVIYDARVMMKQNNVDTFHLFTVSEVTNKIQNTQSLKDRLVPVFGNENAGVHIHDKTDTDTKNDSWGLVLEETGVYDDKNLDNDEIILTNLTENGLYTYINGVFVSKE